MKFENDDEFERLNDRFTRHARDFDDLQNEMSGRDVGKAVRFLQSGPNGAGSSGKSKQERAEALTRLQLLLNDPAYEFEPGVGRVSLPYSARPNVDQ